MRIKLFEEFSEKYTIDDLPKSVIEFVSNWIWQQAIPYTDEVGRWFREQGLVPTEPMKLYRGITSKEYKPSSKPESWTTDPVIAKGFSKGYGEIFHKKDKPEGIVVDKVIPPDKIIVDLGKFLDRCDKNLRYRLGAEDIDDNEKEFIVLP